jgi:hypothetical protein
MERSTARQPPGFILGRLAAAAIRASRNWDSRNRLIHRPTIMVCTARVRCGGALPSPAVLLGSYPPEASTVEICAGRNGTVRSRDILADRKRGASRTAQVAVPASSEGWESKIPDRRQWQCHATDTPPPRGVASHLVVLCRSARSAYRGVRDAIDPGRSIPEKIEYQKDIQAPVHKPRDATYYKRQRVTRDFR